MRLVINDAKSAYFNLACEEYLAKTYNEDMFMMWTSVPSILIGKHQNTYAEINVTYVDEHSIPVVRRMSGGGTVFCDKGNMNFTFIQGDASGFTDFRRFTEPILGYLKSMDIPAQFSGRNDLTIDGKKFSGNAQYKIRGKVVHHGTLLIDSLLSDLSAAITPRKEKFSDKSVKSVASRVTNIFAYKQSEEPSTVEAFAKGLYDFVESNDEGAYYYELTEEDIKEINDLAKSKYESWEWNFGHSPQYTYNKVKKMTGGLVEVALNVKKGIISEIAITGDFFADKEIVDIESQLIGVKHDKEAITVALKAVDINDYIKNVSLEEFIELIICVD